MNKQLWVGNRVGKCMRERKEDQTLAKEDAGDV
jgi:hypothetical protein